MPAGIPRVQHRTKTHRRYRPTAAPRPLQRAAPGPQKRQQCRGDPTLSVTRYRSHSGARGTSSEAPLSRPGIPIRAPSHRARVTHTRARAVTNESAPIRNR